MYDGVPKQFLSALTDESLEYEHVTFCYWRTNNHGEWSQGNVIFDDNEDDGSGWLLSALTVTPEQYVAYAKHYYEADFNRISEDQIFSTFEQFSSNPI